MTGCWVNKPCTLSYFVQLTDFDWVLIIFLLYIICYYLIICFYNSVFYSKVRIGTKLVNYKNCDKITQNSKY